MRKTFQTESTVEEVTERLRSSVEKSQFLNWHQDCIIGKVKKKSFCCHFHKAYIKNSFNKCLYGKIIEKDGVTIIKTIILSPFLSLKLHMKLIAFFAILYAIRFDITTYVLDVVISYFAFAQFLIVIGIISQLIPISDKTKKELYRVVEESLGSDVDKGDSVSAYELDK